MKQFNDRRLNPTLAKRGVAGSVIAILILTVLEYLVGLSALALTCFAWKVHQEEATQ